MSIVKVIDDIKQLQYESDSWKRVTEFIILENAYAKNRLAEVIKASSGDSAFLEMAEFYQNCFIQQETLTLLLRSDIYSFDKLLQREKFEDGPLMKEVVSTRKKLKMEILKLTGEFDRSKHQFDHFLEANS